jgi:DNA anti-recombination protein RmuC
MAEKEKQLTLNQLFELLIEVKNSQTEIKKTRQSIRKKFDNFEKPMAELTSDSAAAKIEIVNLHRVDQIQKTQLESLANQVEEIEQRAINNDGHTKPLDYRTSPSI